VLKSIRSQIFAAFLLLSIVIGGLGAYGVVQMSTAGGIVANLYDKPLMAINFARLASFTFSEMNNELLRERLAGKPADGRDSKLDDLSKDLFDNLRLARERSGSGRPAALIDEIGGLARRWNALRRETNPSDPVGGAAMDKLSTQIIEKFDTMTELSADEGFVQRENAVREIGASRAVGIGATLAALLFSVVVTFLLARRILRPLSAAAAVANRVAGGDFQTAIPKGGADETGMLLASMAAMQANIQEMMEREATQRRSAQARLVDAIEGSREGVMLIDADSKIAIANSQVAEFFPSIASLLVPGVSLMTALVGAAERPESVARRQDWMTLLFSDGEIELGNGRWLRISQSATQEGGRFLFLSDITALKEREESLKAAQRAAESASVAKTNFLANMGHELRTPLNAVIGFSEIIAGEQFGPVGNPQYREYASDILASGRHLLAIINDVLDLAKSTDGKLRMEIDDVDLNTILSDCARIYGERCETAELRLVVQRDPTPVMVQGDEAKLRQIGLNLLSNAIKFTPAGGEITLTARAAVEGMVELCIADTGIGMRQEDVALALEPFGQIDSALARRYEGVGLGLPLTKALVELHSGSLEIESTPEVGTIVRVRFPALVRDAVWGAPQAAA
jgi:signal transduction histidine kinase/HAMP domain-containing protein